jgi:hypothetical protein
VVQQAIGEVVPEPIDDKKKAAQESGRRGGLLGGTARARVLDSQERSAMAKKAAMKRWAAR